MTHLINHSYNENEDYLSIPNNGIDDLKFRVKIVEMQKLKAIVAIDFGAFIIKGFRVNYSAHKDDEGDELWIVPPSYRDGGGKYHPIFYTPNKKYWNEIKSRLKKEYNRVSEEYYKKRMDIDDNTIYNNI